MDEELWLTSNDPHWLGAHFGQLPTHAEGRKRRLYACACCRSLWYMLEDSRSRDAIEASERFADQRLSTNKLRAARERAGEAVAALERDGRPSYVVQAARACVRASSRKSGVVDNTLRNVWAAQRDRNGHEVYYEQAAILRELIDNPFRPVEIQPEWLEANDRTVVRVATAIYDEKRFDEMPVLADALEDAGCSEPALLDHCRGRNTHIRGCWVLDRLMGRY